MSPPPSYFGDFIGQSDSFQSLMRIEDIDEENDDGLLASMQSFPLLPDDMGESVSLPNIRQLLQDDNSSCSEDQLIPRFRMKKMQLLQMSITPTALDNRYGS